MDTLKSERRDKVNLGQVKFEMDRRLLISALGTFALSIDNFVVAGVLPEIAAILVAASMIPSELSARRIAAADRKKTSDESLVALGNRDKETGLGTRSLCFAATAD
jgi:hypothetical protein